MDKDIEKLGKKIENILSSISKIPGFKKLKPKLEEFRRLVLEKRSPRIIVIGRRGSGKSSILNALIDDDKFLATGNLDTTKEGKVISISTRDTEWNSVASGKFNLEWLDTPGTGAPSEKEIRVEKLKMAINEKKPDAILIVIKASEVDGEIDSTLTDLRKIVQIAQNSENEVPPTFVVLSHIDDIEPQYDKKPPYDPDKLENIDRIIEKAKEHLTRHEIKYQSPLIPLSSYFVKKKNVDWRYNIDFLAKLLASKMPEITRLEASRAFHSLHAERTSLVDKIIYSSSVISGLSGGFVVIPLLGLIPMAVILIFMISIIAYLGGQSLSKKAALQFILNLTTGSGIGVAAAFGTITLQEAVKSIPIWGSIVNVASYSIITIAIGKGAKALYIEKKTMEQAREIYKNEQEREELNNEDVK